MVHLRLVPSEIKMRSCYEAAFLSVVGGKCCRQREYPGACNDVVVMTWYSITRPPLHFSKGRPLILNKGFFDPYKYFFGFPAPLHPLIGNTSRHRLHTQKQNIAQLLRTTATSLPFNRKRVFFPSHILFLYVAGVALTLPLPCISLLQDALLFYSYCHISLWLFSFPFLLTFKVLLPSTSAWFQMREMKDVF